MGRLLGQRPHDQRVEIVGDRGARGQPRRRVVELGRQQLLRRRAVEERLAGEREVAGRGQRVDVGGRRQLAAGGLLGRHVGRRADHHVGGGQRVVAAAVARDAEVDQLDDVGLAAGGGHQQVRRLDVAVDHPARVGLGQRRGGLGDQVDRARWRQRAALGHQLLQRDAVEQLHREVRQAVVGDAVVEDPDGVGVGERGGGRGLALEPRGGGGVGVVEPQDLHRDVALERAVPRAPHLAHAADSDPRLELVAAQAARLEQLAAQRPERVAGGEQQRGGHEQHRHVDHQRQPRRLVAELRGDGRRRERRDRDRDRVRQRGRAEHAQAAAPVIGRRQAAGHDDHRRAVGVWAADVAERELEPRLRRVGADEHRQPRQPGDQRPRPTPEQHDRDHQQRDHAQPHRDHRAERAAGVDPLAHDPVDRRRRGPQHRAGDQHLPHPQERGAVVALAVGAPQHGGVRRGHGARIAPIARRDPARL